MSVFLNHALNYTTKLYDTHTKLYEVMYVRIP